MSHKVMILDDDPAIIKRLKALLISFDNGITVYSYTIKRNAEATLKKINDIDVFFLDISLCSSLSDSYGYNFALSIRMNPFYANTPIVFITGYEFPLPKAINEIRCFRFLTKPVSDEIFLKTYAEAVCCQVEEETKLSIRLESGSLEYVKLSEVYYITGEGHTQTYHTERGILIGVHSSLSRIQERGGGILVFCSRSTLVNINHIKSSEKNCKYVTVGSDTLDVGFAYRKSIKELLR